MPSVKRTSARSGVEPETVLILGARGMLGHMLVRTLSPCHHVFGTSTGQYDESSPLAKTIGRGSWIEQLDARDWTSVESALYKVKPSVVINCIGVVKQRLGRLDLLDAIYLNSYLPHKLAQFSDAAKIRLIHISTDCVFEGTHGPKSLTDIPNATDIYGTSKRLGEVNYGRSLTLRTAFVGRQLAHFDGLFEWVRSQRNQTVHGYTNAIYSGLTTAALSRVINEIIIKHHSLTGLYQVASTPISKFDLVSKLSHYLGLCINVIPESTFVCDRSLDGTTFRDVTQIRVPSWDEMLSEFASDEFFYQAG
jgi:dTDP-4-dehydrorhamnose reductase